MPLSSEVTKSPGHCEHISGDAYEGRVSCPIQVVVEVADGNASRTWMQPLVSSLDCDCASKDSHIRGSDLATGETGLIARVHDPQERWTDQVLAKRMIRGAALRDYSQRTFEWTLWKVGVEVAKSHHFHYSPNCAAWRCPISGEVNSSFSPFHAQLHVSLLPLALLMIRGWPMRLEKTTEGKNARIVVAEKQA